jgi:hypothetical protein
MRRAMEAMRTCTDAMLVRWGLDPIAAGARRRRGTGCELFHHGYRLRSHRLSAATLASRFAAPGRRGLLKAAPVHLTGTFAV